MRKVLPLLIILLLYLGMGILYLARTPAWQTPDEPAHYNYVAQLAHGRLPVMAAGDYDQAYIGAVVGSGFAPQYDLTLITYEDWQPPLYYLLLTPVYLASGGALTALRLVSLLLGAGTVALAYGVALHLFPAREWLAWGTAVFVALVPQHLAIMASVNNDSLAELLIAAMLFAFFKSGLGDRRRPLTPAWLLLLGILLGLGFLTKGTVYPMAALLGLALLWHFWRDWGELMRAALRLLAPALLLGLLWWGRNVVVYGGLDVLGMAAHDAVVVGQPRTAALAADVGAAGAAAAFVQTTFRSFWGQFGWMALPMLNPGWLYPLLWLLTAVVLLGVLVWAVGAWRERPSPLQNGQPFILAGLLLLTAGVHVFYNLTFVQHQGRYLFPALIPLGVGVALGLDVWGRPYGRRWSFFPYLIPVGLGAALLSLNVWVVWRILPLL